MEILIAYLAIPGYCASLPNLESVFYNKKRIGIDKSRSELCGSSFANIKSAPFANAKISIEDQFPHYIEICAIGFMHKCDIACSDCKKTMCSDVAQSMKMYLLMRKDRLAP
jgi:hypothetical protein